MVQYRTNDGRVARNVQDPEGLDSEHPPLGYRHAGKGGTRVPATPRPESQRGGPGAAEHRSRRRAIVASNGLDLTGLLRPVREGLAFEETVERLLTLIKLRVVGPGERVPAGRGRAARPG